METKSLNNQNQKENSWEEYWRKSIDEYYRTSRYTGD